MTEGARTDSYTVVLTSQPTANVTVTITPDGQETVDKTTLTFTPSNWNMAQTATVSAADDHVVTQQPPARSHTRPPAATRTIPGLPSRA